MTNSSRNNRFLMLFVGLLAIPAFFPDQPFSPTPATAPVLSGNGPPSAADWVIVGDTVIKDENYLLNGSIVVMSGANLTLTNVTLCTRFNITVNSGGELYLHNCTVTAYDTNNRWFLAARAGSTLLLNATTISYAGIDPDRMYDGVCISTDNAKVINCTLLENAYGLRLYQANDTLIKDNNFTECRIHFEKANNTILKSNSITRSEIYTHTSYNTTIERNNITDIVWPGIWLQYSSNSTVRENTVTDTAMPDYAAIQLEESGHSSVSGNTVTDSSGRGIWLLNSGHSTVHENTITNSRKTGIELKGSGYSSVCGNTVTNSSFNEIGLVTSGGIGLSYSGNSTVSGNTVTDSSENGISVWDSGQNTVSGNTVTDSSENGIYLGRSGQSTVSGNNVTNNGDYGIRLASSGNSTVSGNTVKDNVWGIELDDSGYSAVSENTVTNSDVFGIYLLNSSHSTVSGNTVTNSSGIYLFSSNNSTVTGNTVTDTSWGIRLGGSGHSTVHGNTVTNSSRYSGIELGGSDHSTVSGNIVTNTEGEGILLSASGQSIVSGNTVTNSSQSGIELGGSGNSTVHGNTVKNSGHYEVIPVTGSRYGISLDRDTSNCLLWGNILITNELSNAYDGNGTNQWDNGTHGNWYDDYTGPDLNQDGIGDNPYSIGGGLVEDRYPLMNILLPDTSPPTLDSPADVTYTVGTTGHTITWQPSDANPFWHQILRDGVVIVNATWDGAAIALELDGLASGTYNYTIVLLDRLGYRTTDEVLVTVKPVEEETTEDEPQLIPGFALPLVGVTFAVGWFLTRSRRRKRERS